MSKLGQLRKKMRYETDIPRCENCKEYRKPYVYLTTNSMTKRSQALCKLGNFTVQPNACCDMWARIILVTKIGELRAVIANGAKP